jgi:hypothetical protein
MARIPLSIDTPYAAVSPPQLPQRPLQIGEVFLPHPVYIIFFLNVTDIKKKKRLSSPFSVLHPRKSPITKTSKLNMCNKITVYANQHMKLKNIICRYIPDTIITLTFLRPNSRYHYEAALLWNKFHYKHW